MKLTNAGSMRSYAKGGSSSLRSISHIPTRISWKASDPVMDADEENNTPQYECRERSRDCRSMPCSVVLIRPKRQRGGFLSMSSGEPFFRRSNPNPRPNIPVYQAKPHLGSRRLQEATWRALTSSAIRNFFAREKFSKRYSRASEARIQLRLRT